MDVDEIKKVEDWREERARSWDEFASRWRLMAWVFVAGAVALAAYTVRRDLSLVNWLVVGVMVAAAAYFSHLRRTGEKQAEKLRTGRRT